MIISYKIKRKNFIKNCDIGSGFYYQKKTAGLGDIYVLSMPGKRDMARVEADVFAKRLKITRKHGVGV